MTKQKINFDLDSIANGALKEKFEFELKRVLENVMDLNTDPTKKRKIQINIDLVSSERRDSVDVELGVKSTLAPQISIGTTVLIGQDSKGVVANELKSGVKGQTFIDPETGEIKTDIGDKVDEASNVIDLQNKHEKAGK